MVLGVEGPVAVALGPIGGRRRGLPRAPAQVGDRDVGREQYASSPGPQRGAEVDILEVHEVALVEQAAPAATNLAYRDSHRAFYAKHHPRWAPLLDAYLRLKGA